MPLIRSLPWTAQVVNSSPASRWRLVRNPLARLVQLESVAPRAGLAHKGYTNAGFVEISKTRNAALTIPVIVPEAVLYAVDFRCAIRTLRRGPALPGTVVLHQRGVDEWSNWGYSNSVLLRLEKGIQPLTLALEPANENMNGDVNQAVLDYLWIKKVE